MAEEHRGSRGRAGAFVGLVAGVAGVALFASLTTWWWRTAPDHAWTMSFLLMFVGVVLGVAAAIYSAVRGRLVGLPLIAGLGAVVIAALVVTWVVYVISQIDPNF